VSGASKKVKGREESKIARIKEKEIKLKGGDTSL